MTANADGSASTRLTDYRAHYTADADAIVDPGDLDPLRRASEERRLTELVRLAALRAGESVLDVGCGSGWLADRCRQAGTQVYAVDIARHGIAGVRDRFPALAGFAVGDGYHLPVGDARLDVVLLSEVLEHLEDPTAVLREVRRVLRPRGRVVVSVPYRERIQYHLCIHCNQLTPANAHLHTFDQDSLRRWLREAGLTARRQVTVNNKLLELAGWPRRSRRWPQWSWRLLDRALNAAMGRAAFLALVATPDH